MGWSINKIINGIGSSIDKGLDDLTGGQKQKREKEEQKRMEQEASDKKKFEEFQAQDLLNVDADLYTPSYSRNKKLQKEQEGMLSLFNARKDRVLAARATPGMSQTRF